MNGNEDSFDLVGVSRRHQQELQEIWSSRAEPELQFSEREMDLMLDADLTD